MARMRLLRGLCSNYLLDEFLQVKQSGRRPVRTGSARISFSSAASDSESIASAGQTLVSATWNIYKNLDRSGPSEMVVDTDKSTELVNRGDIERFGQCVLQVGGVGTCNVCVIQVYVKLPDDCSTDI
jgi:hypothetical protein